MIRLHGIDDSRTERALKRRALQRAHPASRIVCHAGVTGVVVAAAVAGGKLVGLGGKAMVAIIIAASFSIVLLLGWCNRQREHRELGRLLREAPHLCEQCGYDVRGLCGGKCPECGRKLAYTNRLGGKPAAGGPSLYSISHEDTNS